MLVYDVGGGGGECVLWILHTDTKQQTEEILHEAKVNTTNCTVGLQLLDADVMGLRGTNPSYHHRSNTNKQVCVHLAGISKSG